MNRGLVTVDDRPRATADDDPRSVIHRSPSVFRRLKEPAALNYVVMAGAGTNSTAEDLERIRIALGEEKLITTVSSGSSSV